MIERNSFLRLMKRIIVSLQKGLTDPTAGAKQDIIEELAKILGVERCVIFGVGQEEIDGAVVRTCEIIAGIPLKEYECKLGQKLPFPAHPDLEDAIRNGRISVVRDPRNDPRTEYFRDIIEEADISEIMYLPLRYEENEQWTDVLVIDAVHERTFNDDEILFCSEVAELLSLLLGRESIMLQYMRDAIINKMVPLEGFAVKLRENLQATLSYVTIIHREAEEITSILPKRLIKLF